MMRINQRLFFQSTRRIPRTKSTFQPRQRFYCTTATSDYIESFLLVKNAMNNAMNNATDDGWKIRDFPSLCKLQGVTSCFGEFTSTDSHYIISVNGRTAGQLMHPNLDVLFEEAKLASFGGGKGLQIKRTELCISGVECLIPPDIQKLAPYQYRLEPKLHKMDIYTPGGHFGIHENAPHEENHLATCLITLPLKCKGGDLTLIDHKEEKSFPLNCKEGKFNWVAFYSDVQYRIEPLISGLKMVLQFNLCSKPDHIQKINEEKHMSYDVWTSKKRETGEESRIFSKLSTELKQKLQHNPNQSFALVLKHQYTLNNLKPELLKNVDQELWKHLEKFFEISLTPVLIQQKGDVYCYSKFIAKPFDRMIIEGRKRDESLGKSKREEETEATEEAANKEDEEEDVPHRGKEHQTWVIRGPKTTELFRMGQNNTIRGHGIESVETLYSSCLVVNKLKQ